MSLRRVRYCPGVAPGRKCWVSEDEAAVRLAEDARYVEILARYGMPGRSPPHTGDCPSQCRHFGEPTPVPWPPRREGGAR